MSSELFAFLPLPERANHYREAYPFGPGTDADKFHTDLGIEVDPVALPNSPALAVLSGLVRWVSDPSPAKTGSLILAIKPALARTVSDIFHSTLAFIYRNIDFASMIDLFDPRIEAIKGTAFQDFARLKGFVNGEYKVWVNAGEELGLPGLTSTGWGRVGFEIVYVPPLARGHESVVRLMELIKPEATTRRLDPLSFYAKVADSASDLSLAPAHANHPLLKIASRRILLELRDEYDNPSDLKITISDSITNTNATLKFDPLQHGTAVLATAPPSSAAPSIVYSFSKDNYLFTDLPSGEKAKPDPANIFSAPAHWALQAIYMPPNDSVATDPQSWFVPNTIVDRTPPLPRYTSGNLITPIRDGLDVFAQSAKAISMAQGSGDFVLMANWWFDDGLVRKNGNDEYNGFELIHAEPGSPLVATTTLAALTLIAGNKGVSVRALLFDQFFDTNLNRQNAEQVDRINALPGGNGIAILDGETALLGSHHQKFMVIKGKDKKGDHKALAFCGGVDFNSNRRDSPAHLAFGGYHDVHAKVEGPAVVDIFQSFKDRWEIHSSPLSLTLDPNIALPPPKGNAFVQVARTYPGTKGYKFAPLGSYTPLEAFLRAIGKAKKFIYIEDQYLTPYAGDGTSSPDPLGVLTALKDALTRIDYLLIVIPNNTEMAWFKKLIAAYVASAPLLALLNPFQLVELGILAALGATLGPQLLGQARFRRRMFIEGLKSDPATKDKVHVFYLFRGDNHHKEAESISLGEATEGDSQLSSGGPAHRDEIYCHSKLWIVDDIIAKIGSANCNRRSYTHDSEMDIVMLDGTLDRGARALARNFRMDLWGEHLGMKWPRKAMLQDHKHALKYWLGSQFSQSHIRKYDEQDEAAGNDISTLGWDHILDPAGR